VSHALVEVYIHAAKTLALMNDRGPLLDKPNWEAADRALKPIIEKLDRDLNVAVGHEFDCDSPKQVAQLLYDKLGMTPPDGSRTTVKPVLEYLQATTGDELHGRILDKINRRRAVGKLKSTYVAAFKRSADRHDGELRTIWWLTGAVTGRLRSGGGDRADILNFQNFANNALIQNMICSDLEWKKALSQSNIDKLLDYEVFLAGDGAQIELRALAELASDKPLIKIFRDHAKDRKNPALDPHCVEGHLLTGLPVEKIKQDQKVRRMVKGTVFGIVYGLGEGNVYPYVIAKLRSIEGPAADLSDITPERCIDTHRKFFEVHGGVRSFHEAMRGMAEKKGYVESLFGFRRDIRQEDETRETYWGNQAVNSPVQSTAHMFILICLALLDRKPKTYSRLQNCIAEIHDALYFRVKLRHLPEAYRQFMQLFEHDATAYAERRFHLKLRVPILAEAKAGFTMASMIDYEGGPLAEFLPAWRDKEKKIEARSWEDLL
jgi:DNA polymerase-1